MEECSHCGKSFEGQKHFAARDGYGECPCCSAACAVELDRVSYFECAGVEFPGAEEDPERFDGLS